MDTTKGALTPVKAGSARHLALIAAGYRTHHVDGQILWLEAPRSK